MRKIFALGLALCCLVSLTVPVSANDDSTTYNVSANDDSTTYNIEATDTAALPEFPSLVSDKMIVMDADTGDVLYHRNGDVQCYPASTTKLLTALLTIENSAMDETVTYSESAVKSVKSGDANATISIGEEMSVEQSLYCLLLRSANDAAYGLGEHVGGTISNFAAMMTSRAQAIGCENTHFTNASGLHDDFHYTTPYDMALIAKECMQNKTLMSILNDTGVYTIPPTNKSTFTRYYSHRYAMVSGGAYAYPYSRGGKTGYTHTADYCLVSFAEKDDLRLICVIMASTDEGRYLDTIHIFDYYFNNFHKVFLSDVDTGFHRTSNSVLALTQQISSTHNVKVGFDEDSYLLVPNAYSGKDLTGIVTYADNVAYTGKPGGFACVSYYVGNFNVGNSTLYITEYDAVDTSGYSGVPVRSHRRTTTTNTVQYVNLWHIIWSIVGGLVVLGLIALLIAYRVTHSRKRRGPNLRF